MASQRELDECYMGCALAHARMSKAVRAKVGAALVTPQGVILPGVNGLPTQLGNKCEIVMDDANARMNPKAYGLKTKDEVIHAELNCIMKAAKEGVSISGSTLYVTLSPCVQCASMMLAAGVKRVVYKDVYRDTSGIDLLRNAGLEVQQYD